MNKIIIALGIALASSTAALAQSSALDVIGQTSVNAQVIDTVETGSISNANAGVEAVQNRGMLGDGSPMASGAYSPIAIETGYLPAARLGGNS